MLYAATTMMAIYGAFQGPAATAGNGRATVQVRWRTKLLLRRHSHLLPLTEWMPTTLHS